MYDEYRMNGTKELDIQLVQLRCELDETIKVRLMGGVNARVGVS